MIYFIIILFLFFIDFFSKKIIKSKFELNKEYKLLNNISIYHIKNKGFAYGMLKNFQNLIKIIINISIFLLFFIFILSLKDKSKFKKIALSFVLGGALGNYYDRIKNKNVTDFIYIKYKNAPIYNFADFFIFIGVIILLFYYLFNIFKDFIKKFV